MKMERITDEIVKSAADPAVAETVDMVAVMESVESANAATLELSTQIGDAMLTANNVWMMLATALVFIMHLGFAGVEAGFGQTKNTVNILFKNTLTPIIGIITYFILGFNLMYPGFEIPGWIGFAGFGLETSTTADNTVGYASGGYTYWTDFLFQAMFAATAATIVSGAVRRKDQTRFILCFLQYSSLESFTQLLVAGNGAVEHLIHGDSMISPDLHWYTPLADGVRLQASLF